MFTKPAPVFPISTNSNFIFLVAHAKIWNQIIPCFLSNPTSNLSRNSITSTFKIVSKIKIRLTISTAVPDLSHHDYCNTLRMDLPGFPVFLSKATRVILLTLRSFHASAQNLTDGQYFIQNESQRPYCGLAGLIWLASSPILLWPPLLLLSSSLTPHQTPWFPVCP